MKYYLLQILTVVFCLTSTAPVLSGQEIEEKIREEISKIISHDVSIDPKATPGCIIGIIDLDTVIYVEFGDNIDHTSIDKNAIFDWGGMSKIVIAVIANRLVTEGMFSRDDLLKKDFPELIGSEYGEISFEELLTHRSGLKRALKGLYKNDANNNAQQNVAEEDFWQALKNTPLLEDKEFLYNHNDYALLELWIEKRTKKDFNKLVDEYWPAMVAPSKNIIVAKTRVNTTNPGLNKAGFEQDGLNYGIFSYSKGVRTSIQDMGAFVLNFCLADNDELSMLMQEEKYSTELSKNLKFSRGWYVMDGDKDYTIFTHSGHSNRHSCAMHFVPETKTGVVIVSNSEKGTEDLSLLVLRMINNNWKRKAYGQEK